MGASLRQNEELDISYDQAADVLYVSIGIPTPALTKSEENGLLVRSDPATHQIVGVTILDYENKFRRLSDMSWLDKKALPNELAKFLKRKPQLK